MLTDWFARAGAWCLAHPEFTALVVVPLVLAVVNAFSDVLAKRFPRLAGVLSALGPHVGHALDVALRGKQLGTSTPPPPMPPNEEKKP